MMWKLIRTEIVYNKYLFGAQLILLVAFTTFALMDISPFENSYFLGKYFWSILVGLGIYLLVFALWSIRKKETRDRLHGLVPVNIKRLSIMRWVLGVSPFLLGIIYLESLEFVLPHGQQVFVGRINAQLSLLFIFIASFDLIINMDNYLGILFSKYRYRIVGVTAALIIVLSSLLIYLIIQLEIDSILIFGDWIFFFIWGFLISIVSTVIFSKRKSYLT